MNLKAEAKRASEMLKGKVGGRVTRYSAEEVCLSLRTKAESTLIEKLKAKDLSYLLQD